MKDGLTDPVDGLAEPFQLFFFLFLILLTEADKKPPGLMSRLTVIIGPRWLQKLYRLMPFARLEK